MREMIEDWDEQRDPTRGPAKPEEDRRRALLGMADRRLLDALADGTWTPEGRLRRLLGWGRLKFLLVTARMVVTGWIEARQAGSFFQSEYRLSEEAWR